MGVPDSAPTGHWRVQTLLPPALYSLEQLERAVEFARALHFKHDRGSSSWLRSRTEAGQMKPGEICVYLADPLLYGRLLILEVTADNRLLCEQVHADKHGEYGRELFDAAELELASRWQHPEEATA